MQNEPRKTFLQVVQESREEQKRSAPERTIDQILGPDITSQMENAVQERNRKAIESEILASKLIISD